MSRRGVLLAGVALLLLGASPVRATDGQLDEGVDLGDLADLEQLVERVEREGFAAQPPDGAKPLLPTGLRFPVDDASLAGDRAFRVAWLEGYRSLCEGHIERLSELAQLSERERKKPPAKRVKAVGRALKKAAKRDAAAAAGFALLQALLPRYGELLGLLKRGDAPTLFAEREAETARFLKRYDFGKELAVAKALSPAVIDVHLTPAAWTFVRGEVDTWRFTPLHDPAGEQVVLGGKKIEFAAQMRQGEVRTALRQLTHLEYFTARYTKVEKIVEAKPKVQDRIRIVGAKLLRGSYFFLDYDDRLVVLREPQP